MRRRSSANSTASEVAQRPWNSFLSVHKAGFGAHVLPTRREDCGNGCRELVSMDRGSQEGPEGYAVLGTGAFTCLVEVAGQHTGRAGRGQAFLQLPVTWPAVLAGDS